LPPVTLREFAAACRLRAWEPQEKVALPEVRAEAVVRPGRAEETAVVRAVPVVEGRWTRIFKVKKSGGVPDFFF